MKTLLATSVFILASANYSQAEPQDCMDVSNDLDRLACYDKEIGRTPAIEQIATESPWNVRMETSEMTDQTNVYMTVFTDEPVNCGWTNDRIALIIRCRENTTSVIFSTGCHMTSGNYNNYGDVIYRLDDEKARTQGFSESTNNRSLGLWNGGSAIPFAKRMFGKERLIARMTPYGENAFTADFDIRGLETEIEPLRKACGW